MPPTASRFEKIKVGFDNLLKEEDIKLSNNIIKTIEHLTEIKLENPLNYNLKNLIVNLDL